MRLCIFEDAAVQFLEPLTWTRPAWSLWCGAASLGERQKRILAADEMGALVRPELADLCKLAYPQLAINDATYLQSDDLVLANARWLAPDKARIDMSRPHVGLVDDQIAYVALPRASLVHSPPDVVPGWLDDCRQALPAQEAGGSMIDFLWDLVDRNAETLVRDWDWFHESRVAKHQEATVLGPADKLVVAEGAVLEPFVVADTRRGPVLIDHGAVIHSFGKLEGPCYVGTDTHIVGAKLRAGTIGPHCRIGGEVEASIVQGYSNKYHDGFLGHSYIGQWVNLAAGTQTSDLRNDYGRIRLTVAGRRIDSGRTKIGSFIGDHSKTGLGVLLNTGSVIGAFSNLLPSGSLLPTVVPCFCQVSHGQIHEHHDTRRLFTTAAQVMGRRGEAFTDIHRVFFDDLYVRTSELRQRAIPSQQDTPPLFSHLEHNFRA
jgi:UDP-N-acetylglucosamine diphosphorylase/glucosamine-1-phosphate N-acetyltransferase